MTPAAKPEAKPFEVPGARRPTGILCATGGSDRPEAETFIGLKSLGFDLCVLCPDDAPHLERIRAAGIPHHALAPRGSFDRKAAAFLRALLSSGRFGVLHLFNNRVITNGLFAARGLDIKLVAYRGIVGNVSAWNPMAWARYLNPRLDRIVCVSEAVRRGLLTAGVPGFHRAPHKLVTIYKGHDLAWYQEQPAELDALGIPAGSFVVGCVANYRPRKGVEFLLRAFQELGDDPALHLLLVGQMNDPRLERVIARSPARARIHRIGHRPDAAQLIAACQVSVLPSLRREGLPKTVIEAMAQGVASVVTNSGGSPELVEDGKSGLVAPPADAPALSRAIARLRADPVLRRALGEAARERIRRAFRIEDTIAAHTRLYRNLLTES